MNQSTESNSNPKQIRFYIVSDEYGEFSNFAAFPITLQGKIWPTSEHYFQAQKFLVPEHQEEIRLSEFPMVAARMGRDRSKKLRPDWESIKDSIMTDAVRAKFGQHDSLGELLLSTGEATLIEHTAIDSYWADGGDGSGKNMLGTILMSVRDELSLIKNWREIILSGRSYVLFKNGTCVVISQPLQDLAAQAIDLLKKNAPSVAGTPSGDFTIAYLDNNHGRVVSFDHPGIITYVTAAEVEAVEASEVHIGILGRSKRDLDAAEATVIETHDSIASL